MRILVYLDANSGNYQSNYILLGILSSILFQQAKILKYAKELKEKETLAAKKKSIVELASKNFTSAEQKAGFEKFIDTQNIDTTKEASALSEKFAGIYGSIFKETIGENKVYQSGGDGAGKFDDVWAKQAERIKNNKK